MATPITRRTWLKATAIAATPTLGCASKSAFSPRNQAVKKNGWIDGHVHVWTPDTRRYPLAEGFTKENMRPPSFTPEQLFAHMRPSGVDRVNLIQMSYYRFDNSYLLDMIERYPGTFVGTAIVDPFGPDLEAEMVRLSKRKCHAFRIYPGLSKQPPKSWLRPEGMEKMFAAGAKHNLILSCLIGTDALGELNRMCGKYPDAPVIIDHLCRIGTGGPSSINDANISALTNLAKHRHVHVKIGAFYALGKKQPPYLDLLPMIRRVVNAFGPDRCLWETDCPFQVANHTYKDSIALIRDRADFLSASDKESILRGTSERLLFRA